jgi:hypothetical protein
MPPQFHHRTTKKEPRCSPRPTAALEERTEEIMDRVQKAGDNQVERIAAPEEYLTLTRAHEGETWFDAGAWTEDLAGSYLALGRVDDAVRTISNTTRSGCAEGTEMLTRSGYEPQATAPVAAGSRRLPRRRLGLCAGWHRGWRHRRPRRSHGMADHQAGAGVAHR